MIESAEEFVFLRHSDERDLYNKAINDSATEETWREIIDKYPEMRVWVARNKTIPNTILEVLADDQDPNVRLAIAQKRKAGSILLEKLCTDTDPSVRLQVALNQKTPRSVLQKLVNDEWERVAEVAKRKILEETY
jgi:hypothetical protein